MASIHTPKSYSRDDFHPTREKAQVNPMHLDNPAAEYERLKKEQGKKAKRKKEKC